MPSVAKCKDEAATATRGGGRGEKFTSPKRGSPCITPLFVVYSLPCHGLIMYAVRIVKYASSKTVFSIQPTAEKCAYLSAHSTAVHPSPKRSHKVVINSMLINHKPSIRFYSPPTQHHSNYIRTPIFTG